MVVRRQRHTAQALTLSIVDDLSRHLIDVHLLKDSLHGLLSIHRDSGLSLCAHLSTCSILPLLELITEVLGGLQRYLCTFLILFQFGLTTDASCLSRFHERIQHIFRHLLGSTNELTFDDHIRKTHRLGFAKIKEIETQFQWLVGSGIDTIDLLTERGDIETLSTTVHPFVINDYCFFVACLDGSTDITSVSAIAGSLKTHFRGNKRKAVLRSERQLQCIVGSAGTTEATTCTIIYLCLIGLLIVLAYVLDGAFHSESRACRPGLSNKTCTQRLWVKDHVVALGQTALIEFVRYGTRDVHTSGILRLSTDSDVRDTYPATIFHLSRPRIDADEQLLALFYLDNILALYFVPSASQRCIGRENGLACHKAISRIINVTLECSTTLCLDIHSNAVDVQLLALRSSNGKLHILVLIVDGCCGPCASTARRSYQGTISIDISISLKTLVFNVCSSGITCNGSLCLVSIVHGPTDGEGVATAQLNNLDSNGYVDTLVALCGSHRAVILTYSGQIHLGIKRLDE